MILSVTIPTYNRLSYLRVMLKSVLDQILAFNLQDEVEIVISDNNSDDGTEKYVTELIKETPSVQLVYSKNEQNIGVVKNILKLIRLARGKYWMFFGDDDLMCEGSLLQIIETLKDNLNHKVFVFKQKGYASINKDEKLSIYDSASRYFYYMGNACTAADTELSKISLEKHYESITTTCWPQTHLYFLCMYNSSQTEPVRVCDLEVYDGQPKDHNNIPNSFYIFDSQMYALFRVAYLISEQSDDRRFLSHFKKGIPFLRFTIYWRFALSIITTYKLFDSERERADFRITLSEAYRKLYFRDKFYLLPLSVLRLVPTQLYFLILLVVTAMYQALKTRSLSNVGKTFRLEKERLLEKKAQKLEKMKLKHAITINRGEW